MPAASSSLAVPLPPALLAPAGGAYPAELLAVVAALELVSQPATLTEEQGRIIYGNPNFLALYRYPAAAVLGQHPRLLIPRPRPERLIRELHRAVAAGGWRGELENMDATGRRFIYALHARPLLLDGGRLRCYLGLGQPVHPAADSLDIEPSSPPLPMHSLSPRERQVFAALCLGEPSKLIADRLQLSPHTVDTYRKRLYRKLGLANQSDLHRFLLHPRTR